MSNNKIFISSFSGNPFPLSEQVPINTLRANLHQFILAAKPDIAADGFIAFSELSQFREQYIADALRSEVGEFGALEQKVVDAISDSKFVSAIDDEELAPNDNFGQRLADKVASFGGSWTFIISFLIILFVWITANAFLLHNKGFDPYPFILLNLLLSCLAAFQAPVIMMSQNRQEEKDRSRAKKDYIVNLKSEVEIRGLHEKLDHMLIHQQQKLLEIQQMQIELLQDILNKVEKPKH